MLRLPLGAFDLTRGRLDDGERAEHGAAEARTLLVEAGHERARRQGAGGRIARAGEQAYGGFPWFANTIDASCACTTRRTWPTSIAAARSSRITRR